LSVALKWFSLDVKTLMIFMIAYTIFTAIIFFATFVTNKAVILTLAVLLAVFVLLDIGLAGHPQYIVWAGYLGILDGLLALYLTAAGILGTLYGHPVLPVGPVKANAE
jgi:hypothetical protein